MPAIATPDQNSLDHRSLAARIERLEQVIDALELVHLRTDAGLVPAPLRLALRDLRAELVDLRGRFELLTPS